MSGGRGWSRHPRMPSTTVNGGVFVKVALRVICDSESLTRLQAITLSTKELLRSPLTCRFCCGPHFPSPGTPCAGGHLLRLAPSTLGPVLHTRLAPLRLPE